MPRLPRIRVPGITLHVVQRGNDRRRTFFSESDYRSYLCFLKVACRRYDTSVHAYVLMTNHVHLLITSKLPDGVSKAMQYTAGSYTRRINKLYQRTGTLWDGRFKSSAVDTDYYCLACYRYIELNPVRAGMVASPEDYRWSSHAQNIGRRPAFVVEPHVSYLAIGADAIERTERYRAIIGEPLPDKVLTELRNGVSKGLPVGGTHHKQRVERALGMTVGSRKRGRPKKKKKGV